MSKNQLTKNEIKVQVERIITELDKDTTWTSDPKGFARTYLNKVLDKIEEYRV